MEQAARMMERAKDFLYRNARLLDRKRYEALFEGGSAQEVIRVLGAYQNADGGFGNALEPDIRCPQSQPVPTEMALEIMDGTSLFDRDLVTGIAAYLQRITLPDGGVPFVFRSAGEYAHTPWWKTERDDVPSLNPTGRIIGLLYRQDVSKELFEEDWFQQNVSYLWRCFEQGGPLAGYHDAVQWMTFLEHTPDRNRAAKALSTLDDWLSRPGSIERNPEAAGYAHKVLDWCPTPESYARKFVTDAEVEEHLRALAAQQQEDGGWPISWPAVARGAELEWRGWITVERLRTLKAYGIMN